MPKKVQFQIVHCSGADEGHSAKELEFHGPTTKGWQSSRFCLYPQEVVLMLKDTQRIRKLQVLAHQYLIPTKIEIFVGRVPIGQPASLLTCKYKRLGYVGLSSNEKTEFKARELKSIHLDAEGQFVKLLIHKNHVNRYNLYNQVNLVAVNVIADPHDNMYDDPLDPDPLRNVDNIVQRYMKPDPFASMTGDPIWGKINRPDFVSPVDDLAFDMYQDPETAELIRKLEAKKKDAVQNERYEYAKKLKAVVADLYKVGEKLGKYEVEKKQAVEQEDYDLAQERKKQSDEFRLYVYKQLNISELLELDGKQYKEHANLHITSPLPPIPSEKTPSPNPPQQQVLRSSPPLKPLNAKSRFSPEPRKPEQVSPRMPVIQDEPLDERPLPALNKSQPDEDNDEDTENSPNSSDGPEPLKDNDGRVASSAIGVFGEHLVQCSFSKQWKFRQEAMDELNKELTSSSPELSHDQDPRSVSRATMFLVKKGIKEKVHSVFMSCLIVLRSLLLTYIPKHKLGKGETHQVLEKVVPELLLKAGETTHRSREAAIDMIIEMAKYDDALLLGIIPDIVTQPFKPKPPPPWRLLKSKLEIIEKLLEVLELDKHKSGSLHSSAIMQFAVTALDHSNGDIRDAAVNLIFIMYKKIGEPIKSYLPDDGPATRKSPLYRSIFDGFDRIDGKPTESERRAQAKQDRKQVEKTKQAEIEALQAQLQALRDMAQGGGGGGGNADIKGTKPTKKKQEEPPVDVDRMCIFCGEKNASFTEDALDLHYWKNCPMLKRCDHCSQVVEVSGFNEHLLSECDAKDKFSQCPKCKDVMLTVDLEEHITEKKCIAPKGSKDAKQCPLCRIEIGEAEEAWYSHLMENCKPNKQRLQQQQASKAPSRASVRSNRGRGGKATPSTRGAARGRKGNLPR